MKKKNKTPKKLIPNKRTPTMRPFKCLKVRMTDIQFAEHVKKLKENIYNGEYND